MPTAAREHPGKQHQQREQEAKKRAAAAPQFREATMEGRTVNMWSGRRKIVQTVETRNTDTRDDVFSAGGQL